MPHKIIYTKKQKFSPFASTPGCFRRSTWRLLCILTIHRLKSFLGLQGLETKRQLLSPLSSNPSILISPSIPAGGLGEVRNRIHTLAVTESAAMTSDNPLLGAPPPPVHDSEKYLPRQCRSILAQLRS